MAKSIRRKGSEWEIPRRVCGHIAPPLKGTRTGFNQQLRHRGATHINCHNVTKHFGATSSRWWGAIHLHGGMCGREHYLLERAALCRLERAAAPCGPTGRAHFFPRLLAWDDSTLKLVVTYDQAYLKLLIRAWILRPCQSLGRNGGRRHNCTSRLLSCTSSPPTAGTFAQQDKCITSQLERANVTHEDRACDNHFMSDDGRMTLGDFDLATVDGSPALNAFGHRMHFLYSTTPYYTAVYKFS